jgi:protocatechuate 3,4-dioxygenase beta subunit
VTAADRPGPNRRDFLRLGGGTALGLALGACSSSSGDGSAAGTGPEASAAPPTTAAPATAAELAPLGPADFEGLGTCTLFPESTAGPFPLEEQLVRQDLTEGYAGHPLRLGLRVVDAGCQPVAGAAVEVWHTDATGDYSAFADGGGGKDEAEGTTFCRGTQIADADGVVELHTIYPGWYPGRAVHLHLRVRVADELVLTGQLYFDDDYTEAVLAEGVYAELGPPGTTNATDGIAGDPAADGSLLVTTPADTVAGPGTLALLNVAVPT